MDARKILIVDDSKNIRKLITVVLKNEGYQFIEAANGLDALAKARQERPDLIILDIMIPGPDGLKVCREIKRGPRTKGIAVMILTSESSNESRDASLEAGADMFLTKPFEPKTLKEAVRSILHGSNETK